MGKKEWNKYVVSFAQIIGYKKKDSKGAAQFNLNKSLSLLNEDITDAAADLYQVFLKNLASHPSLAGLLFSIVSQFSGVKYSFNDKTEIEKENLPEYYTIGESAAEKILYGILYWVFYLAADAIISK